MKRNTADLRWMLRHPSQGVCGIIRIHISPRVVLAVGWDYPCLLPLIVLTDNTHCLIRCTRACVVTGNISMSEYVC